VELVDFLAVEEHFPFSAREVVGDVAMGVFADVGVAEERFAAFDGAEAVFELDFAGAAGLDLSPGEDEAGFEPFHEFVVVTGGAVVADDLESGAGVGLSGAQNVSPALCTQRWRGLRRQYLSGELYILSPKLLF
jgi:hypothetical protein